MNTITLELNDVEVFFLKRALKWRIQNIDYFIQKKGLEGLKKANQLSEKATLTSIHDELEKLEAEKKEEPSEEIGQTVAVADPPEDENTVETVEANGTDEQ